MPDVHPDAPNNAVEAAARAWFTHRNSDVFGDVVHSWDDLLEADKEPIRRAAACSVQALVDGGHLVTVEHAGEVALAAAEQAEQRVRAERDSAVAALAKAKEALAEIAAGFHGPNLEQRMPGYSGSTVCAWCGGRWPCRGELARTALAVFDNPVTPETEEQ